MAESYVLLTKGRIIGEVTEDEARQIVAVMKHAGATELAKSFSDAFGFTEEPKESVPCHDCGFPHPYGDHPAKEADHG